MAFGIANGNATIYHFGLPKQSSLLALTRRPMTIRFHLKKTFFAAAVLLAAGATLPGSDGQARAAARVAPAAPGTDACAQGTGWNIACLRQVYAAPIANWPKPQVADGITPVEMAPVSSLPRPKVDPKVVALGQRLFADQRLSGSNAIACISCHSPAYSFADNKRFSIGDGGRAGVRNTPGLLGAGQMKSLFWDGRAATLEQQALGPLQHPDEMAMDVEALPAKLARLDDYMQQFNAAFGQDGGVTLPRILTALADYQRTLIPPETRFDTFLEGQRTALNDRELLGLHLYRTKARCMSCHSGVLLTDQQFHNLGLSLYGRKFFEDWGRYQATNADADVGKFRTPGLRGVAHSGPWMHHGLIPSLNEVLIMYNTGMPKPKPRTAAQKADPKFPISSELLQPLKLTADELDAMKSFLEVL